MPVRVGFWSADVKATGPVQLYVAPATVGVVRLIICQVHSGELLVATGIAGAGLMVM